LKQMESFFIVLLNFIEGRPAGFDARNRYCSPRGLALLFSRTFLPDTGENDNRGMAGWRRPQAHAASRGFESN
jgi:hypothetical protein